MQRKALMEIFKNLRKGIRDGHDAMQTGRDGERAEGTVKYTTRNNRRLVDVLAD